MLKKLCVTFAVVGIVFIGVRATSVSALSADEIQSQITALLAQIRELSNQLNVLRQQQTQIPPTDTTTSRRAWCDRLIRNLSIGTSGDDVLGVQEYLHDQGYYNGDNTGYFGPVTANAVAQWQSSQGLSSVGIVGPASRERIRRWCGGGGGGNDKFNASPTQGNAPLTVNFNTNIKIASAMVQDAASHKIVFGDGQEQQLQCSDMYANGANTGSSVYYSSSCTPVAVSHTYATNGTYVASLVQYGGYCAGQCPQTTIGTVQIVVGGVTACTMEYAPVCGAKPVVCVTTPCNPVPTTYSNRCMMAADGATFLYAGACRTDYTNPENDPKCKSWFDGCNTCSRSTPGGPAMCTLMACVRTGDAQMAPYCKAYFDGSDNKPPVISGVSGPTTLSVNQSGTWTVNASDPENGNLSYDISWGDEYVPYALVSGANSAPSFVQTSTFTHSYSSSGTFTISVVVRDNSGQSAKTTTTVQVSGTSGGRVTANPASGNAPLSVTFSASAGDEEMLAIDFGDGASGSMSVSWGGGYRTATHTYTSVGTYTAVVRKNGLPLCFGCQAPVVGSVTITVTGPVACTMEYAPVCGAKPVVCITAPCNPVPTTYGNRCAMNADGAAFLYQGVCTTAISCVDDGASYPEGTSRTCISTNGQRSCIADASYICRSGQWTIEGGLPRACTADAMMCPDGTSVGRTGPNCQFVCPSSSSVTCAPGYKWCGAGVYGYSCAYAPSGICPAVL